MKKSFKLSVLMPVFNEVKTVKEIIAQVLKRPEVYELVVVEKMSSWLLCRGGDITLKTPYF